MGVFEKLLQHLDDVADRRSDGTWAVRSPWPSVAAAAGYLAFVLWLGPFIMRDRKPLRLTRALVAYNVLQVGANAYYVYKTVSFYIDPRYNFWCQPMLYNETNNGFALEIWDMNFFFYLLKILDLMDTVFFVLRKKNNQITFLHVYHHFSLIFIMWIAVRFFPGGTLLMASTINAFVHSVMYSYYLLAALHIPWVSIWKPYITTVQLVQFVLNIGNILRDLIFTSCGSPTGFLVSILAQNVVFFWLFSRFYKKNYKLGGHRNFAQKIN